MFEIASCEYSQLLDLERLAMLGAGYVRDGSDGEGFSERKGTTRSSMARMKRTLVDRRLSRSSLSVGMQVLTSSS